MNVNEAIEYLKKLDLNAIEVGKYFVDDDFYYMIQEYETAPAENCKLEAHDNWLDIQWVVSGVENIRTADISRLTVKVPYNPEKDVTFYEMPAVMQSNVLTAGSYLVLYPENAHMPKAMADAPAAVRKCVGKVRLK